MTPTNSKQTPFWGPCEMVSHSVEQTRAVGQRIGQVLSRGLVLRLRGELGSGKTSFVQGLARGLEVPPAYEITSPSYTLIHEYPGRLPLIHVDLYRLAAPVDSDDIGLADFFGGDTVMAVEWADRLPARQWPPVNLDFEFLIRSDNSRMILITAYGLAPDNLIKELFDLIHLKP